MRRILVGLVAVESLVSAVTGLALAQAERPDATLSLTEGTVGELGIQRATATGSVFDLKEIEDFDGNCTAAGAGATIGGGAGATIMKNQNGAVIELKSTTQGASLKLAAEGIKLSVQK